MNMRYIDKSHCCQAFEQYLKNSRPSVWSEFANNIKLVLHRYLWFFPNLDALKDKVAEILR